MIVRFVDIGEIGDYHCLNFLYIKLINEENQLDKNIRMSLSGLTR